LHDVIIDKWEGYRTRRLPLASGASTPSARLAAIRQLMRMEMPDSYKDLTFTPTISVPSQRNAYLRKIDAMWTKYNNPPPPKPSPGITYNDYLTLIENNNQSAECLYLIITVGLDAEDRAVFKNRDVGDTDDDGMPEILDGWGNPIEFIRWAPGFVSDLQPVDPSTNFPDALENHDAFDPLRTEIGRPAPPFPTPNLNKNPPPTGSGEAAPTLWGFNLVPLILSAGPDREYGIRFMPGDTTTLAKDNNPYSKYKSVVDGMYYWRGEADTTNGTTHHDNIHNHLIGTR
jgi:hypothetical protein